MESVLQGDQGRTAVRANSEEAIDSFRRILNRTGADIFRDAFQRVPLAQRSRLISGLERGPNPVSATGLSLAESMGIFR